MDILAIFDSFSAIPAIAVLCLLGAQILKICIPVSKKHLPAFCGAAGMLLGVICFLWIPGFIIADNVLVAAAKGAVSGWAATGIHQTKKLIVDADQADENRR